MYCEPPFSQLVALCVVVYNLNNEWRSKERTTTNLTLLCRLFFERQNIVVIDHFGGEDDHIVTLFISFLACIQTQPYEINLI